jgi:hypothetical protein
VFLYFRDKAFTTYFNDSNYLSMIKSTFGKSTSDHIQKMTSYKINRKHHKEKVNY